VKISELIDRQDAHKVFAKNSLKAGNGRRVVGTTMTESARRHPTPDDAARMAASPGVERRA
jgi:hypothetical protein